MVRCTTGTIAAVFAGLRLYASPLHYYYIVEGEAEKVRRKINELVQQQISEGKKVGVIGTDESLSYYKDGDVRSIGSRKDEITIAQHLFGLLREFDESDISVIYSEAFETPQIGQAIMNRLIKAAGHQIIQV